MYTIIGSENGEKIECSAVVEEKKKLNVVPKKMFVCDFAIVILISVRNGNCKRLIRKIIRKIL